MSDETVTAETEGEIVAFKGFEKDWTCRDFQYSLGQTYEHLGEVRPCHGGFHACAHPLDVFGYYAPATSRFAIVSLGGVKAGNDGDTKIAAAKITITADLSLHEMIERAVKYVFDRATKTKTKKAIVTAANEAASATGNRGAASATGNRGAASATGYSGAASATGDSGAASATGYSGAASATGNRGAASATGDRGAASATGDRGAASATGYSGAASATGYSGAASATGDSGAASATGKHSVAMACGYAGRAMASEGSALFLAERDADGTIIAVWAGIAGRDGIKAGAFYSLRDGKPVEV